MLASRGGRSILTEVKACRSRRISLLSRKMATARPASRINNLPEFGEELSNQLHGRAEGRAQAGPPAVCIFRRWLLKLLLLFFFFAQHPATMASSGDQAAAMTVSTPEKQKEQPKFTIPPLTKATETPLAIRRRLDLKRNDNVLQEQLNNLSLQSRTATSGSASGEKNSSDAAKTPARTPKKTSASRPVPAAMPSPGLRKIRERLGDDSGAASSINSIASRSKEQREADEAAARAVADAEASAARAIDNVLAQQEGLLAAMSLALKSGNGGGSNSAMQSAVLDKIATAVEETTREQLAALSGVAKEGDEIRSTAVYWITMARFEESHGRVDAARTYLTEGIQHMLEGMDCSNNTTQINALRLALERLDKRVAGGKERDEMVATKPKPKPNKLPPSDSVPFSSAPAEVEAEIKKKTTRKSPARPRRRSIGKSESPPAAAAAALPHADEEEQQDQSS